MACLRLHAVVDEHLGALRVVLSDTGQVCARQPCRIETDVLEHEREINELVRGHSGRLRAGLAYLEACRKFLYLSSAMLVEPSVLLAPKVARHRVTEGCAEEVEDAPVDVRVVVRAGVHDTSNGLGVVAPHLVVDGLVLGGCRDLLGGIGGGLGIGVRHLVSIMSDDAFFLGEGAHGVTGGLNVLVAKFEHEVFESAQGHRGDLLTVDGLVLAQGFEASISSEFQFEFLEELAPIVGVNVLVVDLTEEIIDAAFEVG